MGLVLAILALGFLIVVHEAGHYVVARWCKMRVERFSIGFGPGILKYKGKGGTVFQLAPLPFGGFVEIRGMNIAEEIDPEDLQAYPNRPAWQRFMTILAGPATNYISAIFLAVALYTCHGQPTDSYYIGELSAGYDAAAAGKLQPGDRIIKVDGVAMFSPGSTALSEVINKKNGLPVEVTVLRGYIQQPPIKITPKLDGSDLKLELVAGAATLPEPTRTTIFGAACRIAALDRGGLRVDERVVLDLLRRGLAITDAIADKLEADHALVRSEKNRPHFKIGVGLTYDIVPLGFIDATKAAFVYPIEQTKLILGGFRDIFTGKEEVDAGGPVRIVSEFQNAFDRGLPEGIKLLMMLSVYLGLFNLFPLPALDGGRLVFLAYEMITRRRANPKIETMVHMGGIMVLMVVMIWVTLGDVGLF
ncbi:MAG: RIP metalloprotease RseP [Deltaproteobacteria bacterium]|nr:RIP metalloprotease RseP [Deltaproteobacteria bacterium]